MSLTGWFCSDLKLPKSEQSIHPNITAHLPLDASLLKSYRIPKRIPGMKIHFVTSRAGSMASYSKCPKHLYGEVQFVDKITKHE